SFLCPSDGNNPGFTYNGYTPAACNYGNNLGVCCTLQAASPMFPQDGPAYRIGDTNPPNRDGPPVTLAMITDGTSNTAIWSEWIKGKNTKTGKQAIWSASRGYVLTAPYWPAPLGSMAATLQSVALACQPNLNTTAAWDQKGAAWGPDWCGVGGAYSHLLAP